MQDLLEGAAAVCLTSGCGVESLAWCLLDVWRRARRAQRN